MNSQLPKLLYYAQTFPNHTAASLQRLVDADLPNVGVYISSLHVGVNPTTNLPYLHLNDADVVDQASSYTDKNVEMKAINRQIKLISEIDKALARIREGIYGYCLDTAEPIGLKRLIARPVAKYTIAAQEKHEKNEKVHADD